MRGVIGRAALILSSAVRGRSQREDSFSAVLSTIYSLMCRKLYSLSPSLAAASAQAGSYFSLFLLRYSIHIDPRFRVAEARKEARVTYLPHSSKLM